MLQFITTLLLIKNYIKITFPNLDYHSIYRSLFCLFISISSCFTIFYHWETFKSNPLAYTLESYLINMFMIFYMGYDLIWIFVKKRFRLDLVIHHILCIICYYKFSSHILLTYYAINEVISAFNWISLIYPNYDWVVRILKLASILFVRLNVWINGFILMYNTDMFTTLIIFTLLFVSLDIYWVTIIVGNMMKNVAIKTVQYIKKNKHKLRG
jgi:hypothetical protein